MSKSQQTPKIPLPKGWKKPVRSAVLHVLSLAQYAAVYTRGWAADSTNARVRLKAELDRANQELLLLREEIRIKDARLARIDPHRRPHYPPTERMAILTLRVTRGWSLEQAARVFHVTAATIACWMKRVDEQGPKALVQIREPVNKFPDFVRFVVQQLKTLCPTMGKRKMAETLARAGLHLGTTTVGNILKEKPVAPPEVAEEADSTDRVVTSKYANHLWNVDLTTVPIGAGFWCSWLPFTTMKQILRQLPLIPLRGDSFRREMVAITEWYNEHRPHMTLGGKTPNEVYETRFPANRKPRIEPRPGWPRGSPCAKPWALVGGKPGQRFNTTVTFHAKRRHLPVVTLKRAA